MKHVFLLTALCALVSACSPADSNSRSSAAAALASSATYYQQVTPVASHGVLEPIDTSRYSSMHITQSSYLFQ